MKRLLNIGLLCFVLFLGVACSTSNSEKNIIYTTNYPTTDFTKKIVGDKYEVVQLIPNGSEAHDWEPTAQEIAKIDESKMLVYNGVDFEHWIDNVKSNVNKDVIFVDSSKGVALIESDHVHSHDEEESHEGEEAHTNDPHIWLDPMNAKIQMKNIEEALVKMDQSNEKYYVDNYNKYAKELDDLDKEYKTKLKDIKNRDIVVSHEAFGYLVKRYNLKQHGLAGLENDAEPTAAKMAEIINLVKELGITTIFFEQEVDTKLADAIAKETKVKVALLTPIESLSDEQVKNKDDYFSLMRFNLEQLVKALG